MPRILVADDNANIQKMVTLAFQDRGIDVVAVGNGEAAVRKIPVVNPDLVLADIFMPVRNGYEVCEFVKKDSRYADVNVILLVGAFDPLDEKEARRVGADGVLKKPFIPPDPLIAMVMTALEKNPKVAAELAKAKEAKEVIPAPAMPELEIAAKKEPVPLPEFPEPTAEEAAAIYGFGKGVRGDQDEEEHAAIVSKSSADKAKRSREEDEEFGAASASHKWRRAAMDLEIPEALGNQPAFSVEQDFGPITFPSEREVPPRHIRFEEPVEKSKVTDDIPAAKYDAPAASQATIAAIERPAEASCNGSAKDAVEEPVHSSVLEPSPWLLQSAPAELKPPEPISQNEVTAEAAVTANSAAKDDAGALSPVGAHDSRADQNEDSSSAPAVHWMDLMSPQPSSEYRSGSWLEAARSPAEAESTQSEVKSAAPIASVGEERKSVGAESQQFEKHGQPESAWREPSVSFEARQKDQTQSSAQKPSVTTENVESSVASSDSGNNIESENRSLEERGPVGFPYHTPAAEPQPQDAPFAELENATAAKSEFSAEGESYRDFSEPSNTSSQTENEVDRGAGAKFFADEESAYSEGESLEASGDRGNFFADEDSREHVKPVAQESYTPLHSFLPPAPNEPVAQPKLDSSSSEFFDSPPQNESVERIPTLPPQSREDLAGIPFLNPTSGQADSKPADNGNVEAVAQRVLDKLQPQLQDLLSQSVLKPLIENLLQQELEKKGK